MSKIFVVKPIKIPQEKRYQSKLMSEVIRMIYMHNSGKPKITDIPILYEKPEKTDVIKKKYSKIPFLTFSPILKDLLEQYMGENYCYWICYTSYYIFHLFTMLNFVQLYIIIVILLLLYSFRSIFYRLIHDFLLLIPVIPKFYDFIYSLVSSIPMFEFIIQSIQTFMFPLVILLDISIQYSAPCTQDVITTLFWWRNAALIST